MTLTAKQLAAVGSRIQLMPGHQCWEWSGARNNKGYGVYKIAGSSRAAHKLIYELAFGQVPPGLELDHLCRNTKCVHPDHLEPVTHAENMLRGSNAQRSHCKHGHAFTPQNTKHRSSAYPNGARECRACKRIRNKKFRQAR